jgi:hypothetical protein
MNPEYLKVISVPFVEEEIDRLQRVFFDYPPEEIEEELFETLRLIFGDRKLKVTPMLSLETIRKAREAVEMGLTDFVPQHMND